MLVALLVGLSPAAEAVRARDEWADRSADDPALYELEGADSGLVFSVPSLAARLADCVECADEDRLLEAARLHWAAGARGWETCQRAEEVDPALYLRLERALGADGPGAEEVTKFASPPKRAQGRRRRWVHSRSTCSPALLGALGKHGVLLARDPVLEKGSPLQVLWLHVPISEHGAGAVLELRLREDVIPTGAQVALHGEEPEERLFAARDASLRGRLCPLLRGVGGAVEAAARLEGDVRAVCEERRQAQERRLVAEVLAGCVRGLFWSRPTPAPEETPSGFKAALEDVLLQLCRLPGVHAVSAECTDAQERSLLFRSTVAGQPQVAAGPEERERADYSQELSLECREVRGCLTVTGALLPDDARPPASWSAVLPAVAAALARRVHELNKARRARLLLRRTADERASLQ